MHHSIDRCAMAQTAPTQGGRTLASRGASLRVSVLLCTLVLAAACGDAAGPEAPAGALQLEAETLLLARGGSQRVAVSLRDAAGNTRPVPAGVTVVWSTSDPAVATVSNGVVAAVGSGTATITAAATLHGTATASVSVLDGYLPTVLGSLGGAMSDAWVVNNLGVVGGWSKVLNAPEMLDSWPFLWTESTGMTGMLGMDAGVRGINDAGALTGYWRTREGSQFINYGFVFENGVHLDLPPLLPGTFSTVGTSINVHATVVGMSTGDTDPLMAVVWNRAADGSYGPPISSGLAVSPGSSVKINDAGDVAFSTRVLGEAQPVLWRRSADGSYDEPRLLGRPPGASGHYEVLGMNNSGVLVGYHLDRNIVTAVAWHPSRYDSPINLGLGQARGINSHGQIIGTTGGPMPAYGGFPRRPALWTMDAQGNVTGPVDLGTPPGYASGGARAISDNGWIVGSSWEPGQIVATLWRPAN
jgi:uncharacterized membrane protein